MIINIIIGVALALFSLIGFVIGLVKGFNSVKTWASEFVFASLVTIGLGAILKHAGVDPGVSGVIVIVFAALLLLGFTGLSKLLQHLINSSFEKRDYQMRSYGGVGVFNRVWGGFTLALKGFTIVALITCITLTVLDLTQLSAIHAVLAEVLDSAGWLAIEPVLFDFFVIGLMHVAIRHGYSAGISSAIWSLIVAALAVGAFFMAYGLVYWAGIFDSPAQSLSGQILGLIDNFRLPANFALNTAALALNIAKGVITAIIFIILLIVVIIAAIVVSKVLTFARFGSAFYVADGIIGGLVLFLITVGAMLFVGSIIQPLAQFEFMSAFNNYFDTNTVAIYFYKNNILLQFGMPEILPISTWLQ